MPLDDFLRNPLVRKLLASEGVATGLQTLLTRAAHARETLEKGVSQALHAANLPSKDDVASLRRKLEELEAMIDGLAERVDRDRGGAGGAGQ